MSAPFLMHSTHCNTAVEQQTLHLVLASSISAGILIMMFLCKLRATNGTTTSRWLLRAHYLLSFGLGSGKALVPSLSASRGLLSIAWFAEVDWRINVLLREPHRRSSQLRIL